MSASQPGTEGRTGTNSAKTGHGSSLQGASMPPLRILQRFLMTQKTWEVSGVDSASLQEMEQERAKQEELVQNHKAVAVNLDSHRKSTYILLYFRTTGQNPWHMRYLTKMIRVDCLLAYLIRP